MVAYIATRSLGNDRWLRCVSTAMHESAF